MSTGLRRLLAMSLATVLMLAIVMLTVAQAEAEVVDQTCKDIGDFENLETDTSGVWGSVDFSTTEDTLTLTVEEGYEVRLCIKAGSAQQGDGPELTDWFGEGVYEVAHSTGKDLSHYGIETREVTTSTSTPTSTTSTTVIGPPPPPPTTTTTTISSSTTTVPGDTTTTSTPGSSTTVPQSSTTTTPGITSTTPPSAPTTTHNTPSPEELPFTGDETQRNALIGAAVILAGTTLLGWNAVTRREEETD